MSDSGYAPDACGAKLPKLFSCLTLSTGRKLRHRVRWRLIGLVCLWIAAAIVPISGWAPARSSATIQTVGFPGWSAIEEVRGLKRVPLSRADAALGQGFAGTCGKFASSDTDVFVRWINRETRQVHSLADSLAADGYKVESLPALRDRTGCKWRHFSARKKSQRFDVMERIYDLRGNNFTDVSQWYWSAFTRKSRGPWVAITVRQSLLIKPPARHRAL